MIRVAFTLIGGSNWTGGHNYLKNLLTILAQYQKDKIIPVLFIGSDSHDEYLSAFSRIPGIEIVETDILNASRRAFILLSAILLGRYAPIQKLFHANRINVVFESAQFFGWRLGIPAIAWIPDFQHKKLPHLFSKTALLKREVGFRAQVMSKRAIMLSSDDARRDCESYYPSTRERCYTVHFSIPPVPEDSHQSPREIADIYELPESFFYMPNQFWRHKNHELVLEALVILKQRGKNVVVAASGKQNDPRSPEYFPALKAKLERAGLKDSFRLLGMVPYPHLALLMRASSALLNPSLFEGWSTTVEEARSMGVPMILSDLDVHKEQMGDDAIYFDRYSAQSLADTLAEFNPVTQSEREKMQEEARGSVITRVKQFAQNFADLAEACQTVSRQ